MIFGPVGWLEAERVFPRLRSVKEQVFAAAEVPMVLLTLVAVEVDDGLVNPTLFDLNLGLAVDDALGMGRVHECDDMIAHKENRNADRAQLALEVGAQGISPKAISAHLDILYEELHQGVEVPGVGRQCVARCELADLFVGKQSFGIVHRPSRGLQPGLAETSTGAGWATLNRSRQDEAMLEIRLESPADYRRVFAVEEAAFQRDHEALLVETLRESLGAWISLVALEEEEIVGHIFFSPVEIESEAPAVLAAGLGPVAVTPAHQGRGVGAALIREGFARCSEMGWLAVFLLGNPAYYARFGFELAGPRGFFYGSPSLEPAFQVLELDPGVLRRCRGRVRFHPAFDATEPE